MSVQQTIARVRCNSAGAWSLLISGTDVCQLLYRYRHPDLDPFPGAEMRHRLVELGWTPDGRAAYRPGSKSVVDTMLRDMMCGWTAADRDDDSDNASWVWTIPVYREVDC